MDNTVPCARAFTRADLTDAKAKLPKWALKYLGQNASADDRDALAAAWWLEGCPTKKKWEELLTQGSDSGEAGLETKLNAARDVLKTLPPLAAPSSSTPPIAAPLMAIILKADVVGLGIEGSVHRISAVRLKSLGVEANDFRAATAQEIALGA